MGANVTGQLMGTCRLDSTSPNEPRVRSASFSWYRDVYDLEPDELMSDDSPLVLMMNGTSPEWATKVPDPPADLEGMSVHLNTNLWKQTGCCALAVGV